MAIGISLGLMMNAASVGGAVELHDRNDWVSCRPFAEQSLLQLDDLFGQKRFQNRTATVRVQSAISKTGRSLTVPVLRSL